MAEPIDVLEALLFASDIPVEAVTVQDVLGLASRAPPSRRWPSWHTGSPCPGPRSTPSAG